MPNFLLILSCTHSRIVWNVKTSIEKMPIVSTSEDVRKCNGFLFFLNDQRFLKFHPSSSIEWIRAIWKNLNSRNDRNTMGGPMETIEDNGHPIMWSSSSDLFIIHARMPKPKKALRIDEWPPQSTRRFFTRYSTIKIIIICRYPRQATLDQTKGRLREFITHIHRKLIKETPKEYLK